MKILLIGEYSNLHNSLKQGLQKNGHKVVLLGSGDGFKNFDADILIKSSLFENRFLKTIAKIMDRLFGVSLNEVEIFIKSMFKIRKLKDFDIVQLINERAFNTSPSMEKILLGQIFKNNNKILSLILISNIVSLWPIIPHGNFFNNWISIFIFLNFSFYVYFKKKYKS